RDGDEDVFVGAKPEQGGVGALGEVGAAGGAAQAADALGPPGPAVQAQVAGAAPAVLGALGVGAGQVREPFRAHRWLSFGRLLSFILRAPDGPCSPMKSPPSIAATPNRTPCPIWRTPCSVEQSSRRT